MVSESLRIRERKTRHEGMRIAALVPMNVEKSEENAVLEWWNASGSRSCRNELELVVSTYMC